MGRRKSALRRAVSPRHLRWRASRALALAAPRLSRRLNFYGAGVAIEDVATAEAFAERQDVEARLSDAQIAFIRHRAQAQDGPAEPRYWEAPWRFERRFFLTPDALMLGHTGRLAAGDGLALITEDGAPENWNRDKLAVLRETAPVAATALPVRKFSNYFHFMLEGAAPLTAYFESGAAAGRPHAIVSAPIGAGFARATLKAVAARYGAEFIELRSMEKKRLAQAVVWTRRTPCSDWHMARPETAAALRAALLAGAPAPSDAIPAAKLFLRRAPGKIRNLSNAEAFEDLARSRGYAALTPASGNLTAQVAGCAAAERILAVHGAALANLLFAKPGAEVVEVFAADFCKSVYLALAASLGLTHHFSIGGPGDYRQNFEADLASIAPLL